VEKLEVVVVRLKLSENRTIKFALTSENEGVLAVLLGMLRCGLHVGFRNQVCWKEHCLRFNEENEWIVDLEG